jgi:hypothetical protein
MSFSSRSVLLFDDGMTGSEVDVDDVVDDCDVANAR